MLNDYDQFISERDATIATMCLKIAKACIQSREYSGKIKEENEKLKMEAKNA